MGLTRTRGKRGLGGEPSWPQRWVSCPWERGEEDGSGAGAEERRGRNPAIDVGGVSREERDLQILAKTERRGCLG